MTLTPRQVEILKRRHLGEQPYADIAHALGVQPAIVEIEEAEALRELVTRYLEVLKMGERRVPGPQRYMVPPDNDPRFRE